MIKDFRGQVKVADIQSAFDEIVNRINKQVDIYNDAAGLSGIDYTKGSPKLSNAEYTLSVGGLKSVIDAYNGTLIGCRAYRLSDTSVLVSDGLYFKDGQVYRINSRVVAGEPEWDLSDLYYDIDNDTVMFKNGSTSDIIEVQTGWTQPTINSNTDCGVFTASSNSQSAYNVTNSTGYQAVIASGQQGYEAGISGSHSLVWNLPKPVTINSLSFYVEYAYYLTGFNGYADYNLFLDGEKVEVANWGQNNLTINKQVSKIEFRTDYVRLHGIVITTKNLLITGTANSYAIETGGVITPSDNIIKISHLNWESGELILNSLEGFQLEGFHDVKLTSQNKRIENTGGQGSPEPFNNSGKGKFVAYTTRVATGKAKMWGQTDFLGLNLNYAYEPKYSDAHESSSWIATAISLIYIPKGFVVNDYVRGVDYGAARWVYDSKLSK